MVSFYLNLVNLVIPVFLVNLVILQDVVILLNLVIMLKTSGHRGLFGGPTHPTKLTMTIFSSPFFLMIIRKFITICYFPFSWKIDK